MISSISHDEVLGLLRSPLLQGFEAGYVAHHEYTLHEDWGDSVLLAKELAFSGVTRAQLEQILANEGAFLGRFIDQVFRLSRPTDEEIEGEPVPMIEESETVTLGRGFSLPWACTIWLLRERTDADLLEWLRLCKMPSYQQHAQDLRLIFRSVDS